MRHDVWREEGGRQGSTGHTRPRKGFEGGDYVCAGPVWLLLLFLLLFLLLLLYICMYINMSTKGITSPPD